MGPKHSETGCKNLEVWMLLRSLKDKNYVDLVFNWQYYYYYVKTEGVAFLREALGIVEENVAPITFKNTKKTHLGRAEADEDEDRPRGRGGRFGGRGGRGGRYGGSRGGRGGMGIGRGRRQEGDEGQEEAPVATQ